MGGGVWGCWWHMGGVISSIMVDNSSNSRLIYTIAVNVFSVGAI